VPAETVRRAVGLGARAMIEESLRRAGAHDDIDQMLGEFLVHYEANIAAASRPFPGAVASLEAFASAGANLALCTNKRERLTRKLIRALELEHYFSGVAGRDTFAMSKPDPGHLTGVIALAGGKRTRAVMVGDSELDIRAARGAGVPSILVSFGYGASVLNEIAPDAVVDHFDALIDAAEFLLVSAPSLRRSHASRGKSSKNSDCLPREG
jgi:phosphoglycolate phosphatase